MKSPEPFDAQKFAEFWRAHHGESLHTARNWSKADVSRLEWPPASGNWVVVKDMSARPLWFRALAGRYFLKREWRALRALEEVAGVPRALGMLSPDALVMQWCAGTPASQMRTRAKITAPMLEKLGVLMAQTHACGVTHGDLHRENVLIDENGAVCVIDWATASVFGAPFNPLKAWTKREWMDLDRRAVAKLKAYHAPELLSDREKKLLLTGSGLNRVVRGAGRAFRALIGHKSNSSPADAKRRLERELAKADGEK